MDSNYGTIFIGKNITLKSALRKKETDIKKSFYVQCIASYSTNLLEGIYTIITVTLFSHFFLQLDYLRRIFNQR